MSIILSPNVARLAERRLIKAICLAGGFGGRLNAITNPDLNKHPRAKALLPVGARRSIDFSLEAAERLGLESRNLVVTAWHLREQIEEALRDRGVSFSYESIQSPLDTAGAVMRTIRSQGWEEDRENLILVQSADIVHNFPLDLLVEKHLASEAAATIVAKVVPWDMVHRFGVIALDGMPSRDQFRGSEQFEAAVSRWLMAQSDVSPRVFGFAEKRPRHLAASNLANASIYLFSVPVLAALMRMMTKKGKEEPLFPDLYQAGGPLPFSDFGRHLFKWLTEKRQRRLFPIHALIMPEVYKDGSPTQQLLGSYWRDIGFGQDLRAANLDVLAGRVPQALEGLQRTPWGWSGANVQIDPGAILDLSHPSIIGNDCIVNASATVRNSVIGEGTIIETGSEISDSVIFSSPPLQENVIGAGARLRQSIFTGGEIEPGAVFERKIVYSPRYGCGVDSLDRRIEID